MVRMDEWINSVSYTPMLRFSSLAPLLSEYFPDGVGISPATIRHSGTARKRSGKMVKKDVAQSADKKVPVKADVGGGGGGGQVEGQSEVKEKGEGEGRREGEQEPIKVTEKVTEGGGGGGESREGGEGGKVKEEKAVERSAAEPKKREGAKTTADKNGVTDIRCYTPGFISPSMTGHHLPATLLHPLHPFHHPHEGPRAQVRYLLPEYSMI